MLIGVWSGKGYFVLIAGIVAFMLGSAIVDTAKLHLPLAGVIHVVTQGLAGITLWLLTRRIEDTPARVFIEKSTGREIRVKRSAGTFFFVRTRYWSYLLPALTALVALIVILNNPSH